MITGDFNNHGIGVGSGPAGVAVALDYADEIAVLLNKR